jgi:hypothetical protein
VCNDTSYGTIGNAQGKNDVYHFELYGCKVYVDGVESTTCKVVEKPWKPFYTLSGPTLAPEAGKISIPVNEYCASQEGFWQFTTEPFRVVDEGNPAEYTTSRAMNLYAVASMFFKPAEVSFETTWGLSGAYLGTPFKITDTGI